MGEVVNIEEVPTIEKKKKGIMIFKQTKKKIGMIFFYHLTLTTCCECMVGVLMLFIVTS